MEILANFLVILLYMLLAALLIILIILFIKLIQTTNRLNKIVDDLEFKLKTLNGIFGFINGATNGLSHISDVIFDKITKCTSKIFKKERKD